jgi:hypothetical protein
LQHYVFVSQVGSKIEVYDTYDDAFPGDLGPNAVEWVSPGVGWTEGPPGLGLLSMVSVPSCGSKRSRTMVFSAQETYEGQ